MKQWMLLGLLGLGAVAQAHDVWVAAPAHQPAGKILHADLGYSHDFPNVEKIADDRVHIFKPLQLTDSSKKTVDLVIRAKTINTFPKPPCPQAPTGSARPTNRLSGRKTKTAGNSKP